MPSLGKGVGTAAPKLSEADSRVSVDGHPANAVAPTAITA